MVAYTLETPCDECLQTSMVTTKAHFMSHVTLPVEDQTPPPGALKEQRSM